jgi:L-fucose isomerase-like protein
VGTADEIADMIADFEPIARAVLGLKKLKIITFGPRPQDFLACNAPIARLYDLGVEIEENSELDLFAAYNEHAGDKRIAAIVEEMTAELGEGNKMAGILPKLAQYEITLTDWAEAHKGEREYIAFANKCWPSFQTQFGFVPCYVNGRLAARGIPVSCEVDIYGALSEFIGTCISDKPVTLLDINNTVPGNIYREDIAGKFDYTQRDVFMGFHCGNGSSCIMQNPVMKYQKIMHRGLEPDKEPDITRGTLEGDIVPGEITFFRLQSTADAKLRAYAAEGEILPVATRSFGTIGIFAIKEMARFYRHVLIEKAYPHHGCVVFGHHGKAIFEVLKYIGIEDIAFNRPAGMLYEKENPFK